MGERWLRCFSALVERVELGREAFRAVLKDVERWAVSDGVPGFLRGLIV